MSVHDQIYLQMLSALIFGNKDMLQTESGLIDEGDMLPEGMYEPWMRTEVQNHVTELNGVKSASILFTAGPADAPFQQFVVTASLEGDATLSVLHTIPHDEYNLCEIVNHIAHFIITKRAIAENAPGCCCGHGETSHQCQLAELAKANEYQHTADAPGTTTKHYLPTEEKPHDAKVLRFPSPVRD